MKISKSLFVAAFLFGLAALASTSYAYGETKYEYPELMVTPRASERIDLEVKKEAEAGWKTYLPIQVSGLMTFTSGVSLLTHSEATKDTQKYASYAGMGVGAGWLAGSFLLAHYYSPYSTAAKEIAALPKGSQREQLTRERISEEAIEQASSIGSRLTWLSVLTQLGTSGYIAASAPRNSFAQITAAASAVTAFAPLVFKFRWMRVDHEQRDYKKKIYGPIARLGVLPTSSALGQKSSFVPGVQLAWRF